MKLIYIMITYMFVGNHLRANHQSTLTTNRLLHRYLCLQPLPLFLLMWGGGEGEARDFARLLTDYMEGLKDTEGDRVGTHSFFAASSQ
jgi:hypothetical protein